MAHDYDVIVVGSGVAGALTAWKLSTLKPGCRILMLEAGKNDSTTLNATSFTAT